MPTNIDSQPDSPTSALRRAPAGRLGRLCLKELRETLRDRRTILTLIIMPLLMYPLLSIIFQRFLVTTMSSSRALESVIGFERELDAAALRQLLDHGEDVLQRTQPPSAKSSHMDASASVADIQSLGASKFGFLPSENLEHDVASGRVDLGIRLRGNVDPRQLQTFQFDLLHQRGSTMSRRTLEEVTRRLRAVNEAYARNRLQQLGDRGQLPTEIIYQPISAVNSMTASLGTLVPVILVLMTITGAVYPAIDLTAGERERGTLEALIAAPVPRIQLLIAKYVAVLTVAMLTATANVIAMTLTLYSTGIGVTIFGPNALTPKIILQVFGLMVLFAAFFSALLLSITSFARSFKEAQAYLIPLVLFSLAPSLMCLSPDLKLNGLLAICPLVNIVLLARDILQGNSDLALSSITILATVLYATGAIGLAAEVFGSDTVIYGGQASWSDLIRRPRELRTEASVSGAFLFLAMLFPTYVLLIAFLNVWQPNSILARLILAAVVTGVLFGLLPWLAGWYGRIRTGTAFRARGAKFVAFVGAVVLGISMWPLLHQLVVATKMLGVFSISTDQFAVVERLLDDCRQLPPWVIVVTMAVVPAVFEELFFRGYLFSALEKRFSMWKTVLISAALFGAFHVLAKSFLATERFLPSTCMGIVLGLVAWRSGSVFPGMILHACHNGLLLLIFYYRDELAALGWGVTETTNLPPMWIAMSFLGALLGLVLVNLARRDPSSSPTVAAEPSAKEKADVVNVGSQS